MPKNHHIQDLALCKLLEIKYPIIMAPMFLVSNTKMVIAGINAGITGAIPALNYRTDKEFRSALNEIKDKTNGPFGINLIANKSNYKLKEQLTSCLDFDVDFIITSLGSPKLIIEACKGKKTKVFCDVVDEFYAQKVEAMGADAIIAVNKEAGGHAGPTPGKILIPKIKEKCKIPVISAGGIGLREHMNEYIEYGADGFSIGSIFIASEEAMVSDEYKEAIVKYGAKDIVLTTKLSGTPCTVINTPFVQKIGTHQNFLERILNKNKSLKKWVKALTFYKGMRLLKKAAFTGTYKTMWCAGPSIEYVHSIRPVKEIIQDLTE